MASPTFAELWTQIKNAVAMFDDIRTDGQDSVITKLDTYVQSLKGDSAPAALQAAQNLRASYAGLIGQAAAVLAPHLNDMRKAISSTAAPLSQQFWEDLREYMDTNNEDVVDRGIDFGAVSAGGSNVGTGTVYRCTTDRLGYEIQAAWMTTTTFRCVRDQNSGTEVGREVFLVKQVTSLPDRIAEGGSAERVEMAAAAGDIILKNCSFYSFSGTAGSPTAITNWSSTATVNGTNFDFDSTNFFRASPEEKRQGTSYALNIKASAVLTQKLSTNRLRLRKDVPYIILLRYNRAVGSASGTLDLRVGTKEATVAVSAQTGWNTLAITLDSGCWLENFDEDDLTIDIDWTRSGGSLLIDDLVFAPLQPYAGLWWLPVGGATHTLIDDQWTFTDALAGSDAKVQSWLWRAFGQYVPIHTGSGTATITDPS